jgi:hypothetical protein
MILGAPPVVRIVDIALCAERDVPAVPERDHPVHHCQLGLLGWVKRDDLSLAQVARSLGGQDRYIASRRTLNLRWHQEPIEVLVLTA